MLEQILTWLDTAKKSVEANSIKKYPTCSLNWRTLRWTQGPKYFKVVEDNPEGGRGSAYCFIDMEGNIFKPAGYKAPAKGIRGTVQSVDPTKLDGTGGWLYIR